MTLPTHPALQQIHLLDRSSPDFDSQLDGLLHGQAYEDCVQSLEAGDLMWLINYLDNVRYCVLFSTIPSLQHRPSIVSNLPALLPANVCVK